jgi:hypothetical protein
MTAANGWAHDRFGAEWMLLIDAFSAIGVIVIALMVLRQINFAYKKRSSESEMPASAAFAEDRAAHKR